MKRLKIELDFDGVLYNLNENVLKLAEKEFNIELNPEEMTTYNYSCLPEDIRSFIYGKFSDEKIMANNDYLYKDFIEFLKWIDSVDADVELRTLVKSEKIKRSRENFLKNLFKENDIKNVKINVVDDKPDQKCDILIEDNPDAILNKKDGLVIMREHPYNSYIKETENIKKAKDLKEIKKILTKKIG